MARYPIYNISNATTDRPEALGTKEKFWLVPAADTGLTIASYLFKIGRPNTGENWSEKVCCEILRYVGMPCAGYDFAIHGADEGVVSRQFVPINGQFVPANMLLEGAVKGYDGQLRFRQRKYQLSTSLNLIKLRSIGLPAWTPAQFDTLSSVDMFVGYLVFYVLVSNTDRHHENWGVVVDYSDRYSPSYRLAPTFDHASSLGRNETDVARARRLATKDGRDTVEAYASRARSAFYGLATGDQTLRQTEVLEALIRTVPDATRHWAMVFSTIPQNVYEDIFARIEPKLISKQATGFALRMLHANSSTLRSVV